MVRYPPMEQLLGAQPPGCLGASVRGAEDRADPVAADGKSRGISFLMRFPFLDKVPNLVAFCRYVAEVRGQFVDLVYPTDDAYLEPSFASPHVRCHPITTSHTSRRARFPVTGHLFLRGLKLVLDRRPAILMACDPYSLVAAFLIATLTGCRLGYFVVEMPDTASEASRFGRLEHRLMRAADLVITHDRHHMDFLARETGVAPNRMLALPNGDCERGARQESRRLRVQCGVSPNKSIVLHSGGFGPQFSSLELAAAACRWPNDLQLVFHTSYRVDKSEYAARFRKAGRKGRVILHSEPTRAADLDSLVGSADIGLAIYNRDLLRYRADCMGFAAGKIGRYLKNGIPVVVTDLPSVTAYIEEYECGIVVRAMDEIEPATRKLLADYERYSRNALRCYNEKWLVNAYCERTCDRIRLDRQA